MIGILRVASLAAILLLSGWNLAVAKVVVITKDFGGIIDNYYAKYESFLRSGTKVKVDGLCMSACTLVLGVLPPERVCSTDRARFAFHAASNKAIDDSDVINRPTTWLMHHTYWPSIQNWLIRYQPLELHMVYLPKSVEREVIRKC